MNKSQPGSFEEVLECIEWEYNAYYWNTHVSYVFATVILAERYAHRIAPVRNGDAGKSYAKSGFGNPAAFNTGECQVFRSLDFSNNVAHIRKTLKLI